MINTLGTSLINVTSGKIHAKRHQVMLCHGTIAGSSKDCKVNLCCLRCVLMLAFVGHPLALFVSESVFPGVIFTTALQSLKNIFRTVILALLFDFI